MDMVKITPSQLTGRVTVPPSKSYAHRCIISAFLSGEPCDISNINLSADILATLDCLKQLGGIWEFDSDAETVHFKNISPLGDEKLILNCNESGSTLRFLIPIALALKSKVSFTGAGRLMERPLDPYFKIFENKKINYNLENSTLAVEGKLLPGDYFIDGNISSQFITGLLFALPLLEGDSRIVISGALSSKSYVDMTLDVLKKSGIEIINNNYSSFEIKGGQKYKPFNCQVEGDFSQAAFFLVAGALGCDIICDGLNPESLQGDKKILEIIEQTGAVIKNCGDTAVRADMKEHMHGITVDADEIPDLVPILTVLFCFCEGTSRIENAGRLRLKESDRLSAISSELKKMGADITEGEDFLEIKEVQVLKGADLSSWNDHRIAMALSIAACRAQGDVTIDGARLSVKKSYPDFFEDYKALGGKAL